MSLKNIKILYKLPAATLLMVLLCCATTAGLAIRTSEKGSVDEYAEKIGVMRDEASRKLTIYLGGIQEDLKVVADSSMAHQAIAELGMAWNELPVENKTAYLQNQYIDQNPNKLGEKHLLDAANDGTTYSQVHAKYHPWFRELLTQRDYYDIFLFDPNGNLVYTVFKERDFATSAVSGEWKDTDLMKLFKDIKTTGKKGEIKFYDFKPYKPSSDVPAAFIGTPVYGGNGQFEGVLAFQMPIKRINEVLFMDNKAASNVDVHLVGRDHLLRNDPLPKDDIDPILKENVDSHFIDKAFNGETGEGWDVDNGREVLASYAPFDFLGADWMIYVNTDKKVVMAVVNEIKTQILIASAVALIVTAFLTILFSLSLTTPINRMVSAMKKLADRDYDTDVPSLDRGDEIGDMAKTVQIFKENGLKVAEMELQQEALKREAELEKKSSMNMLANDFDSRTSGIIQAMASAATELQATANQMTSSSANTAEASSLVAAAATEADSNVQTVASASEELSASSAEIAKQISSVAQKSTRASHEAETTSHEVSELNSLADSIGEVVGAIKGIAEQTNLLALNATIEAARAGEAGKGFAVVADEVKKLAMETAQKTEQIDERVGKIQNAIRSSVEAVQRIISDVKQIDEATTTVASAVEEQYAATAEIGRNVAEASTGTQQVAQTIISVQRNAEETGQAASTVLDAAGELAKISTELQSQVKEFLDEIRNS
ncbi:MAG: methyl-accepting chemotaxis protein [Micavibrio aeruginosavorus]|uniref:Methyl-accepting chemotaxis protein n=1 Tax=Micavibrio aeruginosavorus TaxID=349221 RepID=A0A2W5FQN6_9BACT|nr:MAG: methyl-accepting chemotaxis protein [Micavibrio aeruginosavorus]